MKLTFALLSLLPPTSARHSFTAEFDATKAIRLTGPLTKIEWTNPHSYFYLDVKDEKDVARNWACGGAGPGALSRRGFKRGDIKIDDTMVLDGYRAKNSSRLIDARRVTLPDGPVIYGSSPGDGGPGDTAAPTKTAKEIRSGTLS